MGIRVGIDTIVAGLFRPLHKKLSQSILQEPELDLELE